MLLHIIFPFGRMALDSLGRWPDVMRLTVPGRRALEAARPLWARAQEVVLGELAARAARHP